jgi:hypothetical protein
MKIMKSSGAGMMALSLALGLAPLSAPVRAEELTLQASHEQAKAIEEWTRTLAVQANLRRPAGRHV